MVLCLHDELLLHVREDAAEHLRARPWSTTCAATAGRWTDAGVRFVADVAVVRRWSDAKAGPTFASWAIVAAPRSNACAPVANANVALSSLVLLSVAMRMPPPSGQVTSARSGIGLGDLVLEDHDLGLGLRAVGVTTRTPAASASTPARARACFMGRLSVEIGRLRRTSRGRPRPPVAPTLRLEGAAFDATRSSPPVRR